MSKTVISISEQTGSFLVESFLARSTTRISMPHISFTHKSVVFGVRDMLRNSVHGSPQTTLPLANASDTTPRTRDLHPLDFLKTFTNS